jgi:hypothetical protein
LEPSESTLKIVLTALDPTFSDDLLASFEALLAQQDLVSGASERGEGDDQADLPADSGVAGDSYESPTWGYGLEWDGDDWEVAEEVVGEGRIGLDELVLEGGSATLTIAGFKGYDGDPEACLAGEVENLGLESGVSDHAPAEDRDGEPIAGESESGGVYGLYTLTREDDDGDEQEWVQYVECRTLEEGEAVLLIVLEVPARDYEDVVDSLRDVLDSIEMSGGSDDLEDPNDGDDGGLEDPNAFGADGTPEE